MKLVAIYARVSTKDQDPSNQLIDLRRYAQQRGWIVYGEFVDIGISGAQADRPQLRLLMDIVQKRKVDGVIVWRFDRFARSTQHLLRSLDEFKSLGVDFISYQENLDTSSPLGQAIFTIVSAVAQLERDIIRERVLSGIRRAKDKGTQLGRPKLIKNQSEAVKLRQEGRSLREIGLRLGIGKSTVGRLLSQNPPINRYTHS